MPTPSRLCNNTTPPSTPTKHNSLPTGLPPEQKGKAKQQQPPQPRGAPRRARGAAGAAAAAGPPQMPGVTTAGLADAGFASEAATINAETRQQDQILDQISLGLDQLKQGAAAMRDEISRQDYGVERLHADSAVLQGRLQAINREGFKKI